ncbi:MAG: Hsp20/alpha crystallin family protein [Actinomycetia bacterium]|nr:Hsp20/alpha crystallin family protein [Actinomycetes bacterium]
MTPPGARPPGGGIPRGRPGRVRRTEDVVASTEGLREVAERLEPIGQRLDEVRAEIADRLLAAGILEDVREITIEIFDEGDEIVAVTHLPGLTEADIALAVDGRELTIGGSKPDHRLSGSVLLPADVMPGWAVTTRNGVVEIRFRKRKEAT